MDSVIHTQDFGGIVVLEKKRLRLSFYILAISLGFCNLSLVSQQVVSESLLKEVILSVYPDKSFLKIEISEVPSIIESKYNWEKENEAFKGTIFRNKKFDSLFIKQQLSERENIYIDSFIERKPLLETKKGNGEFISVEYILFSKDLRRVIIKERHYCGEDCGKEMISLYEKKRDDWVYKKGIIGAIY